MKRGRHETTRARHSGETTPRSCALSNRKPSGLAWASLWDEIEGEVLDIEAVQSGVLGLPKTIDFTVDYLRVGLPRDAYARARVNRSGRRYASVHVEAWQDNRERLFAQASGHFLMPQRDV